MSQLTKEQFEKGLKSLSTKKDLELLATKKDLDDRISGLATKKDLESAKVELKKHAEGLQEELARMVNAGFDDVQTTLDVKEQVQIFHKKFQKLEEALHIRL